MRHRFDAPDEVLLLSTSKLRITQSISLNFSKRCAFVEGPFEDSGSTSGIEGCLGQRFRAFGDGPTRQPIAKSGQCHY